MAPQLSLDDLGRGQRVPAWGSGVSSLSVGSPAVSSDRSEAPAVRPPILQRQTPEQREEFYTLREGIPVGLHSSLLDWTFPWYVSLVDDSLEINLDRVRHLERVIDRWVFLNLVPPSPDFLHTRFSHDNDLLLQATDIALQWADDDDAALLESFLTDARSVYCVGEDEHGNYQLQRRQSEELGALIEVETKQSGRAAEHLRAAWSNCFRRDPDPNDAYGEAVKAIEVAGKPVVTPDDALATLGKMIAAIRVKPDKWETDSELDGSIPTILSMMDMVWKGQLRHGDESAPLQVSQEAAEMTVQTAVLLVSWFRSGRIRLKQ